MAEVAPPVAPSVQPSGQPVGGPAPAEAFGANALGGGLDQIAAAAGKMGDVFAQRAEQIATLNNKAAADANTVEFARQTSDLIQQWHQDHAGQDPIASSQALAGKVEELRGKFRGNLGGPMAESFFDQDSRRLALFQIMDAGREAYRSWNENLDKTSTNSIELAQSDISAHPLDGTRVQGNLDRMDGEIADFAKRHGYGPEVIAGMQLKAHGETWAKVSVDMARTDADAAQKYAQMHWADMTDVQRSDINAHLEPALMAQGPVQAAQGAWGALGASATPSNVPLVGTGGERNHNPLNVGGGNQRFASDTEGWATAQHQLMVDFEDHGLVTPRQLINDPHHGWAAENYPGNTHASATNYINNISHALGIGPDDPINYKDPGTVQRLMTAMHGVEQGNLSSSSAGDRLDAMRSNYGAAAANAHDLSNQWAAAHGLNPDLMWERTQQQLETNFRREEFSVEQGSAVALSQLADKIISGGPNGGPITSTAALLADPEAQALLGQLSGTQRAHVEAQANAVSNQMTPERAEEDARLTTLSRDPARQQEFMNTDLTTLGLNTSQLKHWSDEKAKVGQDIQKQQYHGKEIQQLSNNPFVVKAIQAAGLLSEDGKIDSSDPNAQRNYDTFIGRVMQRMDEWYGANPRDHGVIPDKDLIGIVNRTIAAQAVGGQTVSHALIPDAERARITSELTSRYGRVPSNLEIGMEYQRSRVGG